MASEGMERTDQTFKMYVYMVFMAYEPSWTQNNDNNST